MITIKAVSLDNMQLPGVIYSSIGNPSSAKILQVIKSYSNPDNEIIGIFIDEILVGILGFCKASDLITIRHISVLKAFQRQGLGSLLLDEINKHYKCCKIIAETDEEAVDFYAKVGFICHEVQGLYGNIRYKCEFHLPNWQS